MTVIVESGNGSELEASVICHLRRCGRTLNSFALAARRKIVKPPDVSNGDLSDPDFELSLTDLTKRMRHLIDVMNHFWRRWRDEYLVELRDSHRRSAKDASDTNFSRRRYGGT